MEWIQVLTIVGVNIALIASMSTLMIWAINKLDSDIKDIGSKIESANKRMDGHAMRIDQLYHMFVDLLKEGKK